MRIEIISNPHLPRHPGNRAVPVPPGLKSITTLRGNDRWIATRFGVFSTPDFIAEVEAPGDAVGYTRFEKWGGTVFRIEVSEKDDLSTVTLHFEIDPSSAGEAEYALCVLPRILPELEKGEKIPVVFGGVAEKIFGDAFRERGRILGLEDGFFLTLELRVGSRRVEFATRTWTVYLIGR